MCIYIHTQTHTYTIITGTLVSFKYSHRAPQLSSRSGMQATTSDAFRKLYLAQDPALSGSAYSENTLVPHP